MIEQLKEIRRELLEEIEGLTDEQLNTKTNEETWSIAQVLDHVAFVEGYQLLKLDEALQQESIVVERKDISRVSDRSTKRQSPVEPNSEFKTKQALVATLNRVRGLLCNYVEKQGEETLKNKSMIHRVVGEVSLLQVVEFVGLHEKRHIGQIKEIKERLNENTKDEIEEKA